MENLNHLTFIFIRNISSLCALCPVRVSTTGRLKSSLTVWWTAQSPSGHKWTPYWTPQHPAKRLGCPTPPYPRIGKFRKISSLWFIVHIAAHMRSVYGPDRMRPPRRTGLGCPCPTPHILHSLTIPDQTMDQC